MQRSIRGIQRQKDCLKDINDQGEGTTNYWGLRRNWKYLYYIKQFLEEIKPATSLSEFCYYSNSQRLM